MARQLNKVDTVTLKISTTPKMREYLQDLVSQELYGKTPAEVAERLLSERIRSLLLEGTLSKEKAD